MDSFKYNPNSHQFGIEPIPWSVPASVRIPAALASIGLDEAVPVIATLMAAHANELRPMSVLLSALPKEVAVPLALEILEVAAVTLGLLVGEHPSDVLGGVLASLDDGPDDRKAFSEFAHQVDLAHMHVAAANDPFAELPVLAEEPEFPAVSNTDAVRLSAGEGEAGVLSGDSPASP